MEIAILLMGNSAIAHRLYSASGILIRSVNFTISITLIGGFQNKIGNDSKVLNIM